MITLFGQEAVEGDYVICEHHEYNSVSRKCSAPQFVPAIVSGNKAYTPYLIRNKNYKLQWLRKTSAIVVVPREVVVDYFEKRVNNGEKLINFDLEMQRNINALKVDDIEDGIDEHIVLY